MRHVATLVVATLLFILLGTSTAEGQVSIEINLPAFPELVIVPGYPVYYAPSVRANYFFDDGLYWVFNVDDGHWYSSSWYNGPWVYVEPAYVPQSILVVPYRYYRVRPEYWGGWQDDRPPRWGHQWGDRWESSRRGWDHWDRSRSHIAAPLPLYQKRYDRDHYPAPSQQVIIHNEQYHYQPQDVHVRRRHATILQEQSKGGAKARGKAEWVEKTQHRDKVRQQDKASPQQRDKAQQQEKGQSQQRNKAQQQDKAQQRNKAQQQDKAQQRDKAQQQEKGQSQQRNKAQQQDKAQQRNKAQQQDEGQSQQGHEGTKRQKKGQDQEKGKEQAP